MTEVIYLKSMTPEAFVNEFKELKDSIQEDYFSEENEISRIQVLRDSGLNAEQIDLVKSIFDDALTDCLYTVLLGLDGSATIGNKQMSYKLLNEEGQELTGELEGLAWEAFQNND